MIILIIINKKQLNNSIHKYEEHCINDINPHDTIGWCIKTSNFDKNIGFGKNHKLTLNDGKADPSLGCAQWLRNRKT